MTCIRRADWLAMYPRNHTMKILSTKLNFSSIFSSPPRHLECSWHPHRKYQFAARRLLNIDVAKKHQILHEQNRQSGARHARPRCTTNHSPIQFTWEVKYMSSSLSQKASYNLSFCNSSISNRWRKWFVLHSRARLSLRKYETVWR